MRTADFDYQLPLESIAQTPVEPRDASRLMVLDRASQTTGDHYFFELPRFLRPGDLLVWNNTKVFKARLRGDVVLNDSADGIEEEFEPNERMFPQTAVEIFLIRPMENPGVWRVLARPARKLRLGMKVRFALDFAGEILMKEPDGSILMQFAEGDMEVRAKANQYGEVPLPPYIINGHSSDEILARYQTVYAKNEGSVAAPTAGFHFTPGLIERLERQGIVFAEITLHVGLGTFQPVKTVQVEDHRLHSETVEITAKNADLIAAAKAEGRRVVAVGTTTVRALEGVFALRGAVAPFSGEINMFITPGFDFNVVEALITNFHLPKSTLLMLVAAFVRDREFLLRCYQDAVNKQYRFFSFGDAMFII